MTESEIPEQAITALTSGSPRVIVLTGAGISAESGIPTFRSKDGWWHSHRPEELATPEAFARDPKTVWEWYEYRRGIIAAAVPNPGHVELARWERHYRDFTLVTQNVDGLHGRSGSSQPIELHGNIARSICHRCRLLHGSVGLEPDGAIPQCSCGGMIRPDVVWFGEPLPERALQLAWDMTEKANVFLSVGTSSIVHPAASLATVAREAGAFLIEINPEATEMSSLFDVALRGPAGVVLPALGRRVGVTENAHRADYSERSLPRSA